VSFTVPTGIVAAKFALALALIAATLLATNALQVLVGVLAVSGAVAFAVRDLVARERLSADLDGVTAVRGYAGRRRLAWSEIEQIRVDSRLRLGARSELLELDAGEEIYLFSRFDLGVDPDDAARALAEVRSRR
jgi:hypothetical protein